jgi:hypothetical protein
MRVILIGCFLSFNLIAQTPTLEQLYLAGRASVDRYKKLLKECNKNELKSILQSLNDDRKHLDQLQVELAKFNIKDTDQFNNLESCHDLINWRFVNSVVPKYQSKLHFVVDELNTNKKFEPNCSKIASELMQEERYFFKSGYKYCSEFGLKAEYSPALLEMKNFNDRLEQLLIRCNRKELAEFDYNNFVKDDFDQLRKKFEELDAKPVNSYDECHAKKDFGLAIKTYDVFLQKVAGLNSTLISNELKKFKDLARECEMTLKNFSLVKDSFDSDRVHNCLKYKGK